MGKKRIASCPWLMVGWTLKFKLSTGSDSAGDQRAPYCTYYLPIQWNSEIQGPSHHFRD